MGRLIIKLADHYLAYSTVCDAPVSRGMLFDDFKVYWEREHMETDSLMRVLDRVNEFGTSVPGETLRESLCLNSAGCNSSCLTALQIYQYYCLGQTERGVCTNTPPQGISLSYIAETETQWLDPTISEDGTRLTIA